MTGGLKKKHRGAIIRVLSQNSRVERAVLFGSRATETFTTTSDVDLALFGNRLTITDQARLAGAMEDLSIPQRVDLLLYKNLDSDALRDHIDKHGVELYRRMDTTKATQ